METEGVKTVTITSAQLPGASVPVSKGNIDLGKLDEFFLALAGNGTAGDLAGKTITVTIELAEGYTATDIMSRVMEAARLGFKRAAVPFRKVERLKNKHGLEIVKIRSVYDLLKLLKTDK